MSQFSFRSRRGNDATQLAAKIGGHCSRRRHLVKCERASSPRALRILASLRAQHSNSQTMKREEKLFFPRRSNLSCCCCVRSWPSAYVTTAEKLSGQWRKSSSSGERALLLFYSLKSARARRVFLLTVVLFFAIRALRLHSNELQLRVHIAVYALFFPQGRRRATLKEKKNKKKRT